MAWDPIGMRQNLEWQWNGDKDGMLRNLRELEIAVTVNNSDPNQIRNAFQGIRAGQRHNPPVYNAYEECFNSSSLTFFELVVKAGFQGCDMSGCRTNIDWQWDNNRNSIKNAQLWYTKSGVTLARPVGMYFLLEGQKHNLSVIKGYMSAYNDCPDQLWNYVNSKV